METQELPVANEDFKASFIHQSPYGFKYNPLDSSYSRFSEEPFLNCIRANSYVQSKLEGNNGASLKSPNIEGSMYRPGSVSSCPSYHICDSNGNYCHPKYLDEAEDYMYRKSHSSEPQPTSPKAIGSERRFGFPRKKIPPFDKCNDVPKNGSAFFSHNDITLALLRSKPSGDNNRICREAFEKISVSQNISVPQNAAREHPRYSFEPDVHNGDFKNFNKRHLRRPVSVSGLPDRHFSCHRTARKLSATENVQTTRNTSLLKNSASAPSLNCYFEKSLQREMKSEEDRLSPTNTDSMAVRQRNGFLSRRSFGSNNGTCREALLEEQDYRGSRQKMVELRANGVAYRDKKERHGGGNAKESFNNDVDFGTQPQLGSPVSRKSPGVIGGERRKAHLRSQSMIETTLSDKKYTANNHENCLIVKPRSRSFNNFDAEGAVESCNLCKMFFTSKEQAEEHFNSTKHRNRIAKLTAEPYQKFCEHCKVHLNSKSQAEEHFASARHEHTVTKLQKAPEKRHSPLKTNMEIFWASSKTNPTSYQAELVRKAVYMDSVCFLPTGTGKTLVAANVIANLLYLNPARQVVFLVDRVLLVLQQSDFLREELQDVTIPVFNDPSSQRSRGNLDYRPLRVGAICGEMRRLESGVPIFEHDVLVVTADCYRNHLNNGTLRFEDLALLVLDEAHLCNKEHPYNVIIRDYFLKDPSHSPYSPRLLGLISSLAGEATTDKTVKKLQRLVSNLGGSALSIVTVECKELDSRMKVGKLEYIYAGFTETERKLLGVLIEYATKCFNFVARISELKDYKDIFQPSAGGLLAVEDIYPILKIIDNILLVSKSDEGRVNGLLHLKAIAECVCALHECGESATDGLLMGLENQRCLYGSVWALEQGLPWETVSASLMFNSLPESLNSGAHELLRLLLQFRVESGSLGETSEATVVVKRYTSVPMLAACLRQCKELQVLGISVEEEGSFRYTESSPFRVILTTSLSSTRVHSSASRKLIVQIDPLGAVSALDRIRECWSRRDARCVVISRNRELERKMRDLMLREENMGQATRAVNGEGY